MLLRHIIQHTRRTAFSQLAKSHRLLKQQVATPTLIQASHYSSLRHHNQGEILQSDLQYSSPGCNRKSTLGWSFDRQAMPYHHRQHRLFTSKTDDNDNASTENNITATLPTETSDDMGLPGAQKGGKKLAIVYTCTVCNTRAAKQFTEQAYTNGVVIVQCPGCNNRHLIADNLGFFEDEDGGWNIEKGMAKLGKNVKVVNDDNVLELSIEDVYGDDALKQVIEPDSSTKKDGT